MFTSQTFHLSTLLVVGCCLMLLASSSAFAAPAPEVSPFASIPVSARDGEGISTGDYGRQLATSSSIILPQAGTVYTMIVHAENSCSGNFGLSSPNNLPIYQNYNSLSWGKYKEIGQFSAATELVFYDDPGSTCGGHHLSTDPNWAYVQAIDLGVWEIHWEDLDGANGDFNDLVVRILAFPPLSRAEDRGPMIQYSGWRGTTNPAMGGIIGRVSNVLSDTAAFRFTGTRVTWFTDQGPDQGKAVMLIDGIAKRTVDLYAPTAQSGVTQTIKGLTNVAHTLTIRVSQKNPISSGNDVAINAFTVGTKTTLAMSNTVTYKSWAGAYSANASGTTYRYSATKNAIASLTFVGQAIDWVTAKGPNYGNALVIIDGGEITRTVKLYSPVVQWKTVQSFTGLTDGTHTIQVKVLGTKNRYSRGYGVVVDTFNARMPTTVTNVPVPTLRDEETSEDTSYLPWFPPLGTLSFSPLRQEWFSEHE